MSDKEKWTETDENLSKLLESFTYEDTKRRKKQSTNSNEDTKRKKQQSTNSNEDTKRKKQQSTNSNVNPFESKASKLVHVECNECKGIGGVGFLLLTLEVTMLTKKIIEKSYN